MKKRIWSVLLSVLFVMLLILPTILFYTIGENTDTALDEKRELTERPRSFSSDFFPQLELWYKDHTPFRISLITFQKKQNQAYSVLYRKHIHPVISKLLTPLWFESDEYQARFTGLPPFLAPIEEDEVIYGRDDWLFFLGDTSLEYYKGTNVMSEENMAERKAAFQNLNEICKEKGIKLVIFSAPNKEQVYSEKMPSYYIASDKKRELCFREFMKDSGVVFLYPLEALIAEKRNYDTYYKQDSHWNNVGGYIGVSEIYKALDMPYLPIEKVKVERTVKTGGDLSNFCGFRSEYEDYILDYRPEIDVSIESFENYRLEQFTSSSDSNKNLVMVSDSFRTACKQYLVRDFSKATVMHQNQLETERAIDSIKGLSDGDVLLLLRVERADDGLYKAAMRIAEILRNGQ